MDFLKSAVASAISKGPPFPYTFGERVDIDDSVWALHNGTRREDGSKCSIFAFDVNANKSRLALAKNASRKLRTLRHPGVIKVYDTVETDTYVYIATERVTPLSWHVKRKALNTETIKWGLYSTASTLKFINEDAQSIHGNIKPSSIFTTESGEWKLSGFEVLCSVKDEDPIIYTHGSLVPDSGRFAPPEVAKGGWDALRNHSVYVCDSWNFGTLMYEIFNGYFSNSEQLNQTQAIPSNMTISYKRLIQTNPKMRLSVAHFLDQGKRAKGFFDTPLIRCSEFIENMGVKNDVEREAFLKNLEETKDQFPEDFFRMKILPELVKSVEFGGGGPKVFAVVLMIAEKLSDEEWEKEITPLVVRLFASPDRSIRMFLLENLPNMIDHFSQSVVSNSIFPQLVSGFSDVAPIIREQTVKAILVIVPKLSERQINGDLLKYLAKTQNDDQPGIRTNTTICLGKIARNLGAHTRSKVLTAAFTRSLRDPFVHARNAALLALAATADVFDDVDCATKCMPAICPSLIDKEKLVRVQATKTLEVFQLRIKTLTASMPDSALPPPNSEQAVAGAPRMGTPAQDESWAGWAISSFAKKIVTGQIEAQPAPPTSTPNTPPVDSVPPSSSTNTRTTSSASRLTREVRTSPARALFSTLDDDEDLDPWGDMEEAQEETYFESNERSPPVSKTATRPAAPVKANTEDEIIASFSAKPKPALPKGLARKPAVAANLRTNSANGNKIGGAAAATLGRSNLATSSTSSAAAKKPGVVAQKKIVPKAVPKKEEKDAWGNDESWDDNWN